MSDGLNVKWMGQKPEHAFGDARLSRTAETRLDPEISHIYLGR